MYTRAPVHAATPRSVLELNAEGIDLAFTIHYWVSIAFLPCLVLLGPPLFLPTKWTGIKQEARPSGITQSLLLLSIGSCAMAVVNAKTREMVNREEGNTWCEVNTALMVFVTTATVAHLPAIALHFLNSHPTPSHPQPLRSTRLKVAINISLVYIYAVLALAPSLAALALRKSGGFGQWWGFYCVDRGDWRRAVRAATLLSPALLTLVICFLIATTLYANMGNLPPLQTTWRMWAQVTLYITCACAVIAYVVVEQVIGWYADWWPRALERLPTLVVLLCLCDRPVLRAYYYGIHCKRPSSGPSPAEVDADSSARLLGLGQKVIPADLHYIKVSDILSQAYSDGHMTRHTRTSSFFAPQPRASEYQEYQPSIIEYGSSAYPSPASSRAFQSTYPSPLMPSRSAPATALPHHIGESLPFAYDIVTPTSRRPSQRGRSRLKPSVYIASSAGQDSPPFVFSTVTSVATTITNPYHSPLDEKPKHRHDTSISRDAPSYLSVLATASTDPKPTHLDVDEMSLSQYSTSVTAPEYQEVLEEQKSARRVSSGLGSVVFEGANADTWTKPLPNTRTLLRSNRI